MAKGGSVEDEKSRGLQHHRTSHRVSSGLQITSVDPTGPRGKVDVGTAAALVEGEAEAPIEEEEMEEETSCFTTSHSFVITRCPSGTKHVDPEMAEQKASKVSNELQTCAVDVIQGRAREKYELQRLNDRLSSFIERVRLLEAHNRSLAKEASSLRSNYSSDINRLRSVYNADLDQLRSSLAASEERRAHYEVHAKRAEAELNDVQQALRAREKQAACDHELLKTRTEQLKAAESEVQEIQKRCTTMAEERAKETCEFKRLQEQLKEACIDNDRLSVAQHAAETDAKMLREELEHRKKVQDAELRELSALVQRESTQEAVAVFRTEIMQVLREIQLEYEQRLEAAKADIHSAYEVRARVLRQTGVAGTGAEGEMAPVHLRQLLVDQRRKISALEEANAQLEQTIRELRKLGQEKQKDSEHAKHRLTTELSACQAELQRLRTDFEALLDSKMGLELEIASYRRLIEHEERRQRVYGCSVLEKPRVELVLPEPTPKRISHTRSSKGNISIVECAADGSSVTLVNTGSQREDISGMRLVRQVDDRLTNTFTIPKGIVLETDPSRRLIKIWSEGCKPTDGDGLELRDSRWGTGATTRTVLVAPSGEEKAAYTLRMMSQPCISERSTSSCT
ncbi:70 kDa neurofilament protein [Taenia crassiceps]|uniref:70 kDa neurofilament protein n=1 Tax=Taenia crassiceps TaxID=6207 RepID=A0ABR4QHV7_9CEST